VDLAECASLEAALANVLDFRRCRPDDRMVFERDVDGHLVRFEYHAVPTEYVVMTRDSSGAMHGEKVEVPIERIPVARGGVVRTSLGDALEQAGFGRSLAGLFVEVFESKASFAADARAGDTFRVVVDEERIHGEFLRWGTVQALEYVGSRTGTLRGFHFTTGGDGDYYDPDGRALHGSWLRTPVRYDRISSRFDPRRRHPILRRIVPHNGVDYAAGPGTQVVAAAAGSVTWAGPKGPNGNLVAIRHANGFESFYAHLSAINRGITRGVEVRQRQPIGGVGSTGRSTGPHLHFGLKQNGRFVDPILVMSGPGHLLPAGQMAAFRRRRHELERQLRAVVLAPLPPVLDDEPERTQDAEAPMD
jgi:murein DD-endopeptidase MepM/ murein hydrolase activator NlpD